MQKSNLTHARVLELFDYRADTGDLIWKKSESNRIKIGDAAGAVATNGRRYIGVDGERQLAHRLVWFHQNGEWPDENLTPANGDYLDTRIENLVEQTAQETVLKGGLRSTNTSGVKGVWWDKERQKWAVQTVHNYRTTSHGRFDTLEEAETALKNAISANELSAEERVIKKENKDRNRTHSRMWSKMMADCGGVHGWVSVPEFLADVGMPPKMNYYLAPVDSGKPVGPGNFVWSEPQYDYQDRDDRMASSRSYRDNDPVKYRDKDLRRNYGIGIQEYNKFMAKQNSVCAICFQPETAKTRSGKIKPLAVDHNHDTGAVRGLLCHECNVGIGHLKDSAELLRSGAAYLERDKPDD